jgi:hypothetical protein
MSAVTGKILSAATRAGYGADWALFTDWCTATHRSPLPAEWATIAGFAAGCPGAPATVRRRLAAVAHHRAAGYLLPADPALVAQPIAPSRQLIDPGQLEMLLRLLPSHGWTAGVFGRRDRALLTLAAGTPIPYRQLARLTVGQLHITGGVWAVTDSRGQVHTLEAATDPVLCGPYTLVRWRRVLDTAITRPSTRALADLLRAPRK